jgi:superfamily II DNA/RNA helicase
MGGVDLKRASQAEIGERVSTCTIYGDVFKEWEPYRHMQTMVVLPDRATCNGFLQECLRRGITAKVVDGTTQQDERKDTFSEFEQTSCQMLLGVDVIREGLDLPIAQCLIDLQPTHRTWLRSRRRRTTGKSPEAGCGWRTRRANSAKECAWSFTIRVVETPMRPRQSRKGVHRGRAYHSGPEGKSLPFIE